MTKKGDSNFKNAHISSNEYGRTIHNGRSWEAHTTDGPDLASVCLEYSNTLV